MTEATPDPTQPTQPTQPSPDAAAPGGYAVVLLVEQALTPDDAARVRSLHEEVPEPVGYHVLLPVEDAAAAVQASLGGLGSGEMLAPATPSPVEVELVRDEVRHHATTALDRTVAALRGAGATVGSAVLVTGSPVDALAETVRAVDGREVIVLTEPHVVAEFFHVDWSSQARRKLGVPVLHLLEHETFDEQAGAGEGNTGL